MAFTDDADLEYEDNPETPAPTPEQPSNRPFITALLLGIAAIIATLICMIAYFLNQGRDANEARLTQAAEINATNTAVSIAIFQTAEAQAWTATPTVTPIPLTPTNTPVLALPTRTPTTAPASPTPDRTATVAALLTPGAGGTAIGPTPTGLPDTGFFDDSGFAGLLAAAGVLLLVIFFARRLRASG